MVDVADPIWAIDSAAYGLLNAGIEGATVFQHAPDNTPFPHVIIGDMEGAKKLGGKGARGDRGVPLEIVVTTQGLQRAPCSGLLAQVEALLDGVSVVGNGFRVTFEFEQSAALLLESGNGYAGLALFHVFAIAL